MTYAASASDAERTPNMVKAAVGWLHGEARRPLYAFVNSLAQRTSTPFAVEMPDGSRHEAGHGEPAVRGW